MEHGNNANDSDSITEITLKSEFVKSLNGEYTLEVYSADNTVAYATFTVNGSGGMDNAVILGVIAIIVATGLGAFVFERYENKQV